MNQHRHVIPPPIEATGRIEWKAPDAGQFSAVGIRIEAADDDSRHHRAAVRPGAGWISSLIVHGTLLLLLMLLLAPADLSDGTSGIVLTFLLGDDTPATTLIAMDNSSAEDVQPDDWLTESVTPILDPISIPVLDVPPESTPDPTPDANAGGGDANEFAESGGQASGESNGGDAGPAGSFFGIRATGHSFVYVIDMSGSMRGRRFQRAAAEVVRSISQLRPDQRFYVVMFSDRTLRLLGDQSSMPSMLEPTPANILKTQTWLREKYSGGSTDPRLALMMAMKLKPSAIFMLSDGQFNAPKPIATIPLGLDPKASAFEIVEASVDSVPIHAIAFEDKSSRVAMQRIAEISQGEFRFEPEPSRADAELAITNLHLEHDGDDVAIKAGLIALLTQMEKSDAAPIVLKAINVRVEANLQAALEEGRLVDAANEIVWVREHDLRLRSYERVGEVSERIRLLAGSDDEADVKLAKKVSSVLKRGSRVDETREPDVVPNAATNMRSVEEQARNAYRVAYALEASNEAGAIKAYEQLLVDFAGTRVIKVANRRLGRLRWKRSLALSREAAQSSSSGNDTSPAQDATGIKQMFPGVPIDRTFVESQP